MEKTILDLINNPDEYIDNLKIISFFVMLYENFISLTKERVLSMYGDLRVIDGKSTCDFFKYKYFNSIDDYELEIDKNRKKEYIKMVYHRVKKKDGNYDKDLSLFDFIWKEFEFIDESDYKELCEIKEMRNELVHNMSDCMLYNFPNKLHTLLSELIRIRKKVTFKWIKDIELPTSCDDFDKIDENSVDYAFSVEDFIFDYLKSNMEKN